MTGRASHIVIIEDEPVIAAETNLAIAIPRLAASAAQITMFARQPVALVCIAA